MDKWFMKCKGDFVFAVVLAQKSVLRGAHMRRAVWCQMSISGWDSPVSHLGLTVLFLSPELVSRRDSGACSRAPRFVYSPVPRFLFPS